MNIQKLLILFSSVLIFTISCEKIKKQESGETLNQTTDFREEKKAIIETLNNETRAAFQRDYESWQDKWIHDEDITKIYIDFPESSCSESLGWEELANS